MEQNKLPLEVHLSLKRVECFVKGGLLSKDYGIGYKEGIGKLVSDYAALQAKLTEALSEAKGERGETYPGVEYQQLFDYLYDNHGLTLLQSEMSDIIYLVHKYFPEFHENIPHQGAYGEQWETFWKGIVCNADGSINIDQVKKELYDFSFLLDQIPKVYCHITGSRMSKVMYRAETVISVADDYQQQLIDQAVREETDGILHNTVEESVKKWGAIWVNGQYDRLHDQLKADPEKRITCYVDYNGFRDGHTYRDVCYIKGKRLEFSSRGHCYGSNQDFEWDGKSEKYSFVALCNNLHVEWLDERGIGGEKQNKEVIEFIRDIAENWDCDVDSHTYNTPCRKCNAKELHKKLL